MQATALIGIDWGTTNLRVYCIGVDGTVIDSYRSAEGLLSIADDGFAEHLDGVLARWPDRGKRTPLIACGMVGSRQGWVEAPYVACPARLSALAENLVGAALPDGRTVHLVPGLQLEREDGVMDVMRGEETAIIGATQAGGGLYCLPGTHAKWAHLTDDVVASFATAMTGEVFELLSTRSILGRMLALDAPFDETAFRAGVSRSGAAGGLLHQLFAVRTARLFDRLSEDAAGSYLSGILIGSDVRAAIGEGACENVTVVGDGQVSRGYALAMSQLGASPRTLSAEHAIIVGLMRIATAARLLQ